MKTNGNFKKIIKIVWLFKEQYRLKGFAKNIDIRRKWIIVFVNWIVKKKPAINKINTKFARNSTIPYVMMRD